MGFQDVGEQTSPPLTHLWVRAFMSGSALGDVARTLSWSFFQATHQVREALDKSR